MTTPPKNAKTAAIEALIEAHAIELKLPTVRRRFRMLAADATREQQTPVAYLAALLEAEMAERAERRERRRLIDARFPAIKRLEDFRFTDNPKVPQARGAAARRSTPPACCRALRASRSMTAGRRIATTPAASTACATSTTCASCRRPPRPATSGRSR